MPRSYNSILGIVVCPLHSTLCIDSVSLSVLLSSPSSTTSMAAQLSNYDHVILDLGDSGAFLAFRSVCSSSFFMPSDIYWQVE